MRERLARSLRGPGAACPPLLPSLVKQNHMRARTPLSREPAAGPGWADLRRELDAWADAGRCATFWWRDDDAVAPGPALDRLLEAAAGVPLALAVIPARAEAALARRLEAAPGVAVLQHGWDHANHAPAGERKSELGPHRPLADMAAELAAGRERLRALFGARALPVLAPPWNRIAPELAAALPDAGFVGLSTYRPRPATERPRLMRVNTHIDPVDWHDGRGFLGETPSLLLALDHLRGRRLGLHDADEPTGLLTHHRVTDEACWAFVARFLAETRRHPAARWVGAGELFSSSP